MIYHIQEDYSWFSVLGLIGFVIFISCISPLMLCFIAVKVNYWLRGIRSFSIFGRGRVGHQDPVRAWAGGTDAFTLHYDQVSGWETLSIEPPITYRPTLESDSRKWIRGFPSAARQSFSFHQRDRKEKKSTNFMVCSRRNFLREGLPGFADISSAIFFWWLLLNDTNIFCRYHFQETS